MDAKKLKKKILQGPIVLYIYPGKASAQHDHLGLLVNAAPYARCMFANSIHVQRSMFFVIHKPHWSAYKQYWIAQQNEVHPDSLVPTTDNNR